MALTKYNYNSFDITPVASKALAFNSDADGLTTAAEASMVLIKTLTSDGSDANLSFVNGSSDVVLDSTYPIYKFVFTSIHGETDNKNLTFNMSIDTGSNYNVTKTSSAFLSYHNEAGNDAGVQYAAAEDLAQSTAVQNISGLVGTDNDASTSGELFLYSPSSTTFVKHFMSRSHCYRSSVNYNYDWFIGGYGNTTSAVDAVQFKMASGEIQGGKIKLYGIKDS
tara:strand:+ start:637 stop:1305 length:669 start_codon:yes stop_codon:yes gene_type:complete